MRIGERKLGTIALDRNAGATLSQAQSAALLAAVLTETPIRWSAKGSDWTLSNKGANAVLLKMDEFQGRLGTPGALVRKGMRAETSVLPPLTPPEVTAVKFADDSDGSMLIPATQRAALLTALRTTIGEDKERWCELFDKNAAKLSVSKLSEQQLMVSLGCWQAAYNSGDGYWVVNARPPYAPVLVTTCATEQVGAEIYSIQQGRGIGDCLASDTWTWDGRRFVHSSSLTTGMCRQIAAGGAWQLPTLVMTVKKAK